MLYQRYGHIYNSKNYNNKQIAVYLFSTEENAIKYIKKELTKHNKLLKKYKQAYINKKEYLNKFNKIKLQYPEYFL
jgi:acylphosphatase